MKRCHELGCPVLPTRGRRSHCAGCHETFTSVSAFDRHQTLDDGGSVCYDPATRGLVLRDGGLWSRPGDRPMAPFRGRGSTQAA